MGAPINIWDFLYLCICTRISPIEFIGIKFLFVLGKVFKRTGERE